MNKVKKLDLNELNNTITKNDVNCQVNISNNINNKTTYEKYITQINYIENFIG